MPCAKCNHGICDKEPDFDENEKKNRQITRIFIATKKHLEEYESGDRSDPPTDKAGIRMTKMPNPTLLPTLLRCHCLENFHSQVKGGRRCHFAAKLTAGNTHWGSAPSACAIAPSSATQLNMWTRSAITNIIRRYLPPSSPPSPSINLGRAMARPCPIIIIHIISVREKSTIPYNSEKGEMFAVRMYIWYLQSI